MMMEQVSQRPCTRTLVTSCKRGMVKETRDLMSCWLKVPPGTDGDPEV